MITKGKLSGIKQGIDSATPNIMQGMDEDEFARIFKLIKKSCAISPQLTKDDTLQKILAIFINEYNPKHATGISSLINTPEFFYESFFPEIRQGLVREKRWLNFETPNRVLVTHEYIVKSNVMSCQPSSYYLFSPTHRLAWLQIFVNDVRVSITGRNEITDLYKDFLDNELNAISDKFVSTLNESILQKETITVDDIKILLLEKLETLPNSIPTFITIPNEIIESNENCVINVKFFDSFRKEKGEKNKCEFFSLWNERKFVYEIHQKSKDHTFWIYIKAPNHFHINSKLISGDQRNITGECSDPEIVTYWVTKTDIKDKNIRKLKIETTIKVPDSLKTWLWVITVMSLLTIAWVSTTLLDKLNIMTILGINSLAITKDYISAHSDQDSLLSAILAMIAFILSARSWLIHEETVLSPITKWFNRFSIVLLFLICLVVLIF